MNKEQVMITIPFEEEMAKKITNGEIPGAITTVGGNKARIVCWDLKNKNFPILAILERNGEEFVHKFTINGSYFMREKHECDLRLQVPEWTQLKDGDVVTCTTPCNQIEWVSVLEELRYWKNEPALTIAEHVNCMIKGENKGEVSYDDFSDNIGTIRLATEEEKQGFIKRLKEENTDKAKEILKKFFGIEEKKECEFQPFDKVLVRDFHRQIWVPEFFVYYNNSDIKFPYRCMVDSYTYCIPYNEQTKHLIGTTENWEEEE